MKKTIEVVYGNGLTIQGKRQYENERPLYSAKSIIEINGEAFDEKEEYQRLRNIVDPLVTEHYNRARADQSGVRIRLKDGKKYPSVTSILQPDPLVIPGIDIEEYALRGTEIHRICNVFVERGVWEVPCVQLPKLKFEDIPYQKFFEKFKDRIEFVENSAPKEVWHERLMYSGEEDMAEVYIDGVPCIADMKTGQWSWHQLIAYWQADKTTCERLAIFDFKKTELKVFDLQKDNWQTPWEDFLIKRGRFQERYGV